MREASDNEPVSIDVFYRSTLKKLQAEWVGALAGVDGSAKLLVAGQTIADKEGRQVPRGLIDGTLVNRSGVDLSNVYFAFNVPPVGEGGADRDILLYVPEWPGGASLDLGDEYRAAGVIGGTGGAVPGRRRTSAVCWPASSANGTNSG